MTRTHTINLETILSAAEQARLAEWAASLNVEGGDIEISVRGRHIMIAVSDAYRVTTGRPVQAHAVALWAMEALGRTCGYQVVIA